MASGRPEISDPEYLFTKMFRANLILAVFPTMVPRIEERRKRGGGAFDRRDVNRD